LPRWLGTASASPGPLEWGEERGGAPDPAYGVPGNEVRLDFRAIPLLVALAAFDVSAQAWPAKPLRAIVPVGAGSSTDIVHRIVLDQLSEQLGRPIVVENRAGAGGVIGTAVVAKALPDGYTLLANGAAHTIAPALYKNLSYDSVRDFTAVVPLGSSPSVLVVSPASGMKTAADLVAAAKARPGALNFSLSA
jgi:tripartite-type tricarboxylate transporter receptor subunit TctC